MGWRERKLARQEAKRIKRRQRNNFGLCCLALAVRLRQGRQLADYKRREEWTRKQRINVTAKRIEAAALAHDTI